MKTCTADVRPPAQSFKEYISRAFSARIHCEKPAVYTTIMGPRCCEHGEALLDAAMSDTTLLGIMLEHKGQRPPTREEARKRFLKTIQ